MRIFREKNQGYLLALTRAILKDPSSLSAWRCLRIKPDADQTISDVELHTLSAEHSQLDCDLVFCEDGDILLISRQLKESELQNLADALLSTLPECVPEITLFSLYEDWRELFQLLCAKIHLAPEAKELREDLVPEEMRALRAVFTSTTQHRKSRRSHYVMIVEDDPMTRRMVSHAFKDKYAVITASNVHDALSNYLLYAPDIVFLDIGLPDGSGFDVLATIQASDPDAYVVMFSGNSYLDNVTNALTKGAQGFIAKPFKKENMERYIEDSLIHHQKIAL